MTKPQLTDRQKDVYELIRSLIQDRGYGPTVREIGEHFGIKSPNGVMCHLRALEKKGLILRRANKSRAIELVGDHARSKTGLVLMGVVSDHPVELDLNPTDAIDLGKSLATGDRFTVQISGNALRDRCILDGDYLVLETAEQVSADTLVLAKLNDGRVAMRIWDATSPHPVIASTSSTHGSEVLGVAVALVREGTI
ncbi:transcriptional repressor LexA [Neorhodopirellula pilleata]|uniref:LexA repressor n=1 Tax=Neorhodopirellula pilleata TaxID=2714738 RepID=A0A5C5ZY13_9BACT|nr:transcriptional repressor LexA [Neorhodopirellula pilleata]TWT92554.1 LexA repressor [Neorhodopirellula pilleata]